MTAPLKSGEALVAALKVQDERKASANAEVESLRRELGKRDDFLYQIRNVGQEYERHLEDLEREARS